MSGDAPFDWPPDPSTVEWFPCPGCGEDHPTSTGVFTRDGRPYAHYRTMSNVPAGDIRVAVALEPRDGAGPDDGVQMNARYGYIEGEEDWRLSLAPGAAMGLPDVGPMLDREAALEHPRVDEFWTTVDVLYNVDPVFHQINCHNTLPHALNQMDPDHDLPWISRWLARRRRARR